MLLSLFFHLFFFFPFAFLLVVWTLSLHGGGGYINRRRLKNCFISGCLYVCWGTIEELFLNRTDYFFVVVPSL